MVKSSLFDTTFPAALVNRRAPAGSGPHHPQTAINLSFGIPYFVHRPLQLPAGYDILLNSQKIRGSTDKLVQLFSFGFSGLSVVFWRCLSHASFGITGGMVRFMALRRIRAKT